MFLAEAGEAQVHVMRDLCGKRRRHHRRLEWEHSGLGKRYLNILFLSGKIHFESRKLDSWKALNQRHFT